MQGVIPDSSVPITTGTAPDLGPVATAVQVPQTEPTLFPKPAYQPKVEEPKNYRPQEYGISEAVWGGMLQTAWAAAMMANDMPSIPVQPNYNADAELEYLEQTLGYQVSDDDREHLLRSRSAGEFGYRNWQITQKAEGLQAMAGRPVLGTLGAAADVDILLGYGIGAASKGAKLGRAATMSNLTAGTALGTAGTYAYAGPDAPFNVADASTHVALASGLAFLYGTGFKYNKPLPARPGPVAPDVPAVPDAPATTAIVDPPGIPESTSTPPPQVPTTPPTTAPTTTEPTAGAPIRGFHRTTADFEGPFEKRKNRLGVSFAGTEGYYFSKSVDEPTATVFGTRVIEADLDIKNPAPVYTRKGTMGGRDYAISILPVDAKTLPMLAEGRSGFVYIADSPEEVLNNTATAVDYRDVNSKAVQKALKKGKVFTYINPEKLYSAEVAILKANGHDGIVIDLVGGSTPPQIVVLSPDQIQRTGSYIHTTPQRSTESNPLEGTVPVDVQRVRTTKAASKKITTKPEESTDDDILDAIEDYTDEDFADLD